MQNLSNNDKNIFCTQTEEDPSLSYLEIGKKSFIFLSLT
jgi:hypothetical protein